jgi:hypothetical protein
VKTWFGVGSGLYLHQFHVAVEAEEDSIHREQPGLV